VKRLTLTHWGKGSSLSPVPVADVNNPSTTFDAAASAGHYNLAEEILYIAAAQYKNPEELMPQLHSVDIYAKLADEVFSMNDIKNVHQLVHSPVTPMKMFRDSEVLTRRFQMNEPDQAKFTFRCLSLLPMVKTDIRRQANAFQSFMERGWTVVLEEQIKSLGSPFEHMIIQGKLEVRNKMEKQYGASPVLQAARFGSIKSVEFFQSDKPMAAYKEFAATHSFDTRKRSLEAGRDDFLKAVDRWLKQRSMTRRAFKEKYGCFTDSAARQSRLALFVDSTRS